MDERSTILSKQNWINFIALPQTINVNRGILLFYREKFLGGSRLAALGNGLTNSMAYDQGSPVHLYPELK